jgi:hypothetical protein
MSGAGVVRLSHFCATAAETTRGVALMLWQHSAVG